MRKGWLLAAAAVWGILLSAGLVVRVSRLPALVPTIFAPRAERALIETGEAALNRVLSRLRSVAGTSEVILFWHDFLGEHDFALYRAAYELFPARVWYIPLPKPPARERRTMSVRLERRDTAEIERSGILLAGVGLRGLPDEVSVCRVTAASGDGRLDLRPLSPQPEAVQLPGARTWWAWPVGVGAVLGLGLLFNSAVGLTRGFGPAPTAGLALGFLSGAGLVHFSMLAVSFAGLKWSLPLAAALLAAIGSFLFWYRRQRVVASVNQEPPPAARGRLERLGLVLVVIGVVFAVLQALAPVTAWHNWDAWAIWDFKVRACWQTRGIPWDYLRDPRFGFTHQDYPLGLPVLQTWLALVSGGVEHVLLRLLSPIFLLALVFITAHLLRGFCPAEASWLFAGLLALVPRVLEQAWNGYADLPAAAAMAACLALALEAARGRTSLLAVAWMGAIAASVKAEGLVWAVSCLAAAGFAGRRGPGCVRRVIAAAALLVLLVAPWELTTSSLGLRSIDRDLSVGRIVSQIGGIPLIVKAALLETVGPGISGGHLTGESTAGLVQLVNHLVGGWLIFWHVVLVVMAFSLRRAFSPRLRIVTLVLAVQALSVAVAYLATVHDLGWHLTTSLPRVLLQLAPAAWVLVLAMAFPREEKAP